MTYRQMRIAKQDGSAQGFLLYDEEDAEIIEAHTWYLTLDDHGSYATTSVTENGRKYQMRAGQILMGWGPWGRGRVLHKNGNGLDVRRKNLTFATQKEIVARRRPMGRSQYKGVSWDKEQGKWLGVFQGKKVGRFRDPKDAAIAVDIAAFAYWGWRTYLNFPERFAAYPPEYAGEEVETQDPAVADQPGR